MRVSKSHSWADLTWPELQARNMGKAIVVPPVAAVEQHGPHLPLGTDAMIMQGYLDRVVARLPGDFDVLFLPLQQIGTSHEHIDFAGTLTLSPDTFMRVVADIGASLALAGVRKLVLLNSHGGNSAALEIAARELRRLHGMLAVCVSWARFGYPEGLFAEEEIRHGIHGGDIETSLMLAFRPELVRQDEIADFPPASIGMARDYKWLNAGRPAGFGWMAQDLSPTGAMGNAALATAEKGERLAEHGAAAFIELLRDVAAFNLAGLENSP